MEVNTLFLQQISRAALITKGSGGTRHAWQSSESLLSSRMEKVCIHSNKTLLKDT